MVYFDPIVGISNITNNFDHWISLGIYKVDDLFPTTLSNSTYFRWSNEQANNFGV